MSELIQTGDKLLFHNTRWNAISKSIQAFIHSKWHHTGVCVENWKVPTVNEAVPRGVLPCTIADYPEHYLIRILRKPGLCDTYEKEKAFAVRANSLLGKTKYDFASLGLWYPIYIWFGKWKGRTKEKAMKRMTCYEYAAWCLKYPEWWKIDPEDYLNDPDFEIVWEGTVKELKKLILQT